MDILVADDNPAIRLIARAILEREGHRVELASGGAEAVDMVREGDFGVVLLDILMPRLDGMRVFRRIHALQPQLTVIALTSYDHPADVRRYLTAGFDGVIAKPLKPGDFSRALHLVDTGEPAILSAPRLLTDDAVRLPLIDAAQLQNALGRAARPQARAVYERYKQSLAKTLDTLQSALPGAVALDPEALRDFRDALHALKSSSSMIGLSRAPVLAGKLRNAPPTELREGVRDVLVAIRDSLPELERALSDPSLALGEVGAGMKVGAEHETESAHHHKNHGSSV